MQNARSPLLTQLDLPGEASRWKALGFSVPSGQLRIGQVDCRVDASEASWGFTSADVSISGISSIPRSLRETGETGSKSTAHANGASKIDHVVVVSDDPAGTRSQFESSGFVAKGERFVGEADAQRSQTFFWSGELLLELVGPAHGSAAEGPRARIWGVTFVVDELDRLEQAAGGLVNNPRAAVQSGRKIAVAGEAAGIGMQIAFMTPHIRRADSKK